MGSISLRVGSIRLGLAKLPEQVDQDFPIDIWIKLNLKRKTKKIGKIKDNLFEETKGSGNEKASK